MPSSEADKSMSLQTWNRWLLSLQPVLGRLDIPGWLSTISPNRAYDSCKTHAFCLQSPDPGNLWAIGPPRSVGKTRSLTQYPESGHSWKTVRIGSAAQHMVP
jgi:hypothetical protein